MINRFLATLDGDATAPAGILWPALPDRTIDDAEAAGRAALIGVGLGREQRFLRCLQLTCLVEDSPLSGYVTRLGQRVTYTRGFVRDRLRPSGVVASYTGPNDPAPMLNLTVNQTTPEMASWTVTVAGGSATIVDDLGFSHVTVISYVAGATNDLLLPFGRGSVRLFNVAPANGDVWTVSYKRPGASWVPLALGRLSGVNLLGLMDRETKSIYLHSPVSLDRLAAAVVALGGR